MEPQEKLTTQQFVVDRLHDIQRKAEAKNYADALASIKEVKAADTKNIYLIAIEKQIAKLSDGSLPEENRNGIVKSLPAMIDRAITDIQRRAPVPKVDDSQKDQKVQKDQKEAALEKLKSQYFQRADDYVEKHEYQRALEEIRRIYIIEPGSVVAKEYEQKIEQLTALHARSEAQAAAAAAVKEQKTEIKEQKKAAPVVEPPKEKVVQQTEEEPKKSKLPMILSAAAVVVLALGVWFIFGRGSSGTQTPDQLQQPSLSQESVPPTTTPPVSQTKAEPPLVPETPKKMTKAEKKQTETKTASQVQKALQPEVTPPSKTPATSPTKTAQVPADQPPTKQQASPPPPAASAQQPSQQQPAASESAPAPMPFVAIESPPEVLRREPAKYPEIAIKMGIQGKVFVEVTVDAQGKPIQTKVVRSSSDVFNDAAIEAVMKYTFKPAMQSTGPVTARMTIPIDFRLK